MKRLTAYISGSVQKVGYRGRVVQMANALGLKGIIENLNDGRVKIVAEGEEDKLGWFEEAIEIKNTLIQVSSVEKSYSEAKGEFNSFYKAVGQGETDSRLDQGVEVLKEILVAVKDMNANLGGKMDSMLDKQDDLLNEVSDARRDLKSYMDRRFEQIEVDVAEMKTALKKKGII
jgi:acylphosphatase